MPEFMGQATLNELVGGFSLESVEPGRRRLVVVACTPAASRSGQDLGPRTIIL
jgi:hypothetical protein